jgi:hypothetical protein
MRAALSQGILHEQAAIMDAIEDSFQGPEWSRMSRV